MGKSHFMLSVKSLRCENFPYLTKGVHGIKLGGESQQKIGL